MRLALPLGALLFAGCPSDLPCVEELDASCAPLSQDLSWSNVYSTVVTDSCASAGISCHASEGAAGGLDLGDEETAWTQLVEPVDAEPRVMAGDASCSEIMKRVHTDNSILQMPPGSALSSPQSCMIQLWIDEGASR